MRVQQDELLAGEGELGQRRQWLPLRGRDVSTGSTTLRRILRFLGVVWALPWTLVGVLAGLLGVATGGRLYRCNPVLEFHGGAVDWLLVRCPGRPCALTLGHTVLGRSAGALEFSRPHELVHVRQYERWGLLFVPAYLGCALCLKLMGRDAYHENPFEREACEIAPWH